ncbi:SDR family NAD(P)-dependent oxidoreductase, partial [Bradyrhizobium sp.]|uniref:SDR family NAD(P)-dependent oxidoreductase n=1 Tax=Bradyrhizobium sp. TaxID=376 RepID=UPI00291054A1
MDIPAYKIALIVGAGEGLSASLARLFAREKIRVALAARKIEKLGALCSETGARAYPCDATNPDEVERLFGLVEREIGPPDLVVYNASARARGALVAGVDDKGPAKPAGIEPGDVVVKFDGHDIKEPKDLSRIVADTAVGKEVDVIVIRKGQEQTLKVKLGRLEDNEKVQQAAIKKDEPAEKPQTQKALGLDLAALSKDLRTRYKIK